MKKQFRTAMLSTACMLIVAVMSLTGVTYAWFTAGENATVSGMTMNVATSSGGIQVSETSEGGYATNLQITLDTGLVMPVSSKDGQNFFDVDINPANAEEIASKVAASTNYISKKLYLVNTGTEKITVDLTNTTITSVENTLNSNRKDDDLVNAARLAIIVNGQLAGGIYAVSGDDDTWYAIKAASNKAGEDEAPVYFDMYASNATYTEQMTPVTLDQITIELEGISETGAYNPVEIIVAVWLEGQDRDAITLNAGGAFDIDLAFTKVTE